MVPLGKAINQSQDGLMVLITYHRSPFHSLAILSLVDFLHLEYLFLERLTEHLSSKTQKIVLP